MKITLREYDSSWPQQFQAEQQQLQKILHKFSPAIEHIGSTSVPGLAAKPIIDILIGFSSMEELNASVDHFQLPDYRYMPKYEDVMPFRRYILKGAFEGTGVPWKIEKETKLPSDFRYTVTHHIHMVEASGDFWKDHLLFRDYLRAHEQPRIAYELMKTHLAEKEWNDMNDYAQAKTGFIKSVLEKARNECQ